MKPYTIILADDHAMMRDGIRNLIEGVRGLEVIAETGDGLELLKIVNRKVPEMVILDISMPGLRGIEAAREILALHPQVHILILSMHKREEFLAMALAAGARGYLLKEDTGEELLAAIERVRQGHTFLSSKLVNAFPSDIISICRGTHGGGSPPSPNGNARSCSSLPRDIPTVKSVISSSSACGRSTITAPISGSN